MLGDDPPRDRTSQLRAMGFPSRHLGSVQMTTDTALGVTKMVADDKSEIPSNDGNISLTQNPVPLAEIPYLVLSSFISHNS